MSTIRYDCVLLECQCKDCQKPIKIEDWSPWRCLECYHKNKTKHTIECQLQ